MKNKATPPAWRRASLAMIGAISIVFLASIFAVSAHAQTRGIGAGSLVLDDGAGHTVTLFAPSMTGSYLLKLPPSLGSTGQTLVIQPDGSLQWQTGSGGVGTFSGGSTGLTPNTPTSGNVVLSGILAIANGGTGNNTGTAAPSGTAGGDLANSYPNPTIANTTTAGGDIIAALTTKGTAISNNTTGNAATASALSPGAQINGTTFTGASNITITAAPSGTAGGDLANSYPNPTIANTTTAGGDIIAALTTKGTAISNNTTGNAATASALSPGAQINGTTFTGASNITITAAPSGTAGGDLANSYPNPTIANTTTAGGDIIAALTTKGTAISNNTTGNAATASALSPGAQINGTTFTGASNITITAAPSGTAGGDLANSYPNPTIANTTTAGGDIIAALTTKGTAISNNTTGNAATASALSPGAQINGTTFTGASNITITAAPSGTAGGDLANSYPNPTIANTTTAGGDIIAALTTKGTAISNNTTGNAATVTNGVYTTGSYNDPSWITGINYSILNGTVPTWNQNTTGNAATASALNPGNNINGVGFTGASAILVPVAVTDIPAGVGTYYPTFVANAATSNQNADVNTALSWNNNTGTLTATTFSGALNGNAATVTNGVYTTGSYNDPSWITGINYSVLNGTVPTWNQNTTGNAATVTNGVYTTGSYNDPSWITGINYSVLNGTVPTWNQNTTGNAATVTNGVYTTGSYNDPSWITGINYSVLNGTVPTWNQNTTGNAATASALNPGNNINGVGFTGASAILVPVAVTDIPAGVGTYYPTFVANAATSNQNADVNTALSWNNNTGTLTATTFSGALNGNAATVTNGVYTTGSYNDPSWITGINYSVLNGTVPTWNQNTTGNAATVTNGVYTTGSYNDPSWITGINYSVLNGTVPTWNQNTTGNAATVTNGVYTTGSYNDPSWITGINYSVLNGTVPTWNQNTTGNAATVTNGVYTTGSYNDPSWITGINYSILNGTVPTWNQNTTGNAATASALSPGAQINGVNFTGATNITVPVNTTTTSSASTFYPTLVAANSSSNQSADVSGSLSYVPSTGTLSATGFVAPLYQGADAGGGTATTVRAGNNTTAAGTGGALTVAGGLGGSGNSIGGALTISGGAGTGTGKGGVVSIVGGPGALGDTGNVNIYGGGINFYPSTNSGQPNNNVNIQQGNLSVQTGNIGVASGSVTVGGMTGASLAHSGLITGTALTLTTAPFTTAGVVHNNASGVFSSGQIVDADITAGTIDYSKINNESASTLLGNPSPTTAAAPSEITLGSGLSFTGSQLNTVNNGTVTSVGMSVPSFLSVTPSSISSSGTFAVTLSGSALPGSSGGTGYNTYTAGDILYAATTGSSLSTLGVASGAPNDVLTISGGVPKWLPPATSPNGVVYNVLPANAQDTAASGHELFDVEYPAAGVANALGAKINSIATTAGTATGLTVAATGSSSSNFGIVMTFTPAATSVGMSIDGSAAATAGSIGLTIGANTTNAPAIGAVLYGSLTSDLQLGGTFSTTNAYSLEFMGQALDAANSDAAIGIAGNYNNGVLANNAISGLYGITAAQQVYTSIPSAVVGSFTGSFGVRGDANQNSGTNKVVGVWGYASNTGTSNTGSIGVLGEGNGLKHDGQTNTALDVLGGEINIARQGTTLDNNSGSNLITQDDNTAADPGPSGVVDFTSSLSAPTANTIVTGTLQVYNVYANAASIVLCTVLNTDAAALDMSHETVTATIEGRGAGQFTIRVTRADPTGTNSGGSAYTPRIGFLIINANK